MYIFDMSSVWQCSDIELSLCPQVSWHISATGEWELRTCRTSGVRWSDTTDLWHWWCSSAWSSFWSRRWWACASAAVGALVAAALAPSTSRSATTLVAARPTASSSSASPPSSRKSTSSRFSTILLNAIFLLYSSYVLLYQATHISNIDYLIPFCIYCSDTVCSGWLINDLSVNTPT